MFHDTEDYATLQGCDLHTYLAYHRAWELRAKLIKRAKRNSHFRALGYFLLFASLMLLVMKLRGLL